MLPLQYMAVNIKIPVLLNYGGAVKSSFDMSLSEFKTASVSIRKKAREKAFSKGLPVYVSRHGKTIAEYPDGSTKIILAK